MRRRLFLHDAALSRGKQRINVGIAPDGASRGKPNGRRVLACLDADEPSRPTHRQTKDYGSGVGKGFRAWFRNHRRRNSGYGGHKDAFNKLAKPHCPLTKSCHSPSCAGLGLVYFLAHMVENVSRFGGTAKPGANRALSFLGITEYSHALLYLPVKRTAFGVYILGVLRSIFKYLQAPQRQPKTHLIRGG